MRETENPSESENQKLEFGLSIFGENCEKPISQLLKQNDQEKEEDFAAKIYAIHSRSSAESHMSNRIPTRLTEQAEPEQSKEEPEQQQYQHSTNVSMTLLTSELKKRNE